MERDSLRSLGMVGGVVVLIRAAAESATFVPGAEVVYDSVMVVLSLAITSGEVPSSIAGSVLWIFYIGVFYRLLPDIFSETFPNELEGFSADRGLVILLSVLSVGFGVLMFVPFLNSLLDMALAGGFSEPIDGLERIDAMGFGFLFGVLSISGYLSVNFGNPLESGSEIHEALVYAYGDRIEHISRKYRGAGRTINRVGRGIGYTSLATLLTGLCFALGGTTVILTGLSPLPELLLISVVVYSYIPVSLSVSPGADVESNVQRAMRVVLRNPKGWATIPSLLVGLFFSLGIVAVGFVRFQQSDVERQIVMTGVSENGLDYILTEQYGAEMAWVGSSVLLIVSGLLYAWYWERLIERLPRYIQLWEEGDVENPSVTLPPYSVAVPLSLSGVAVAVPVTVPWLGNDIYTTIHRAIGLLWPIGLGIGVYWLHHTVRSDPQPARNDRFAVPLALGASPIPFVFMTSSGLVFEFYFAFILLTGLYFWPDFRRKWQGTRIDSWIASVGIMVIGVLFFVLGMVTYDSVPLIFFAVAALAVLSGIFTMYREYGFE